MPVDAERKSKKIRTYIDTKGNPTYVELKSFLIGASNNSDNEGVDEKKWLFLCK